MRWTAFWLASAFLLFGASAQTEFDAYIASTAKRVKESRSPVYDEAEMLPSDTERTLASQLAQVQASSGVAIVVVTLPSLKGGQLDDFTNRLFEQIGIGEKGVDKGVLLLIAQAERQMRIETGYGVEGDLTDTKGKLIIDQIITPQFRKNAFASGIQNGVYAIIAVVAPDAGYAPRVQREEKRSSKRLPILFFVIILILSFFGRGGRRRGRYRRGGAWYVGSGGFAGGRGGFGGGGGGFGGFGGGSSGGGGASGGW